MNRKRKRIRIPGDWGIFALEWLVLQINRKHPFLNTYQRLFMGLMQKLRSGTKYIIWILILSFGLLWVLADTQVFDAMMSGPQNMGEVNRTPISYAEFNQRVNMFTEQHRQQTGTSPDTEVRAQYEEMAWEQLVVDKILQKKMDDMGIIVTDSELVDMVTGENPDPFIRQQFTREDGTIDRIALQHAIEAPENREVWIMIEQELRQQRRQQKLQQFMQSSIRVSDLEIEQEYKQRNSRADFRYIRFPYSDISSEDIEVSSSEIRSYYRNNQDRFLRNKSWNISFVTFPIAPTAEDTTRTIQWLADLRDEFAAAENVERFLNDNFSETRYFDSFLKPSDVRTEHLKAYELQPGEVSEPFVHGDRVHMIRVLEDRPSDQLYVRVRQIQLHNTDSERRRASDIMEQLNEGASFSKLAADYSRHRQSAERGGDMGYIERTDKPEAHASAIFNAAPGSVVGPLEGEDGLYIYQIVDRTNREIRFADLSQNVEADPFETVQRLANEAEDFQYFAASDGFVEEAERNEYTVEEAMATEGNPFIPGLGQSRIVLNELAVMRAGRVSNVIETEDHFIVFKVNEIIPEGPRPMDEVQSQIETTLRNQKRQQMVADQARELRAASENMEALAEASGRDIGQAERIRMNAMTIPGVGRETALVGAAFSIPEGQLSNVITGRNAAFVLVVDQRRMADVSEMTSADRRSLRDELVERKTETLGRIWMDRLKADAEIRDFRVQQRLMQPM
ncbi:peptidyl-prolyl cis-trans isomerase [Balneolaceae bacterium ANBcel3]|nr:peptidyl-prolyl cis-trans isomerase [Balneolaceae bacterium ANBcel3]